MNELLWTPTKEQLENSNMFSFIKWLNSNYNFSFDNYNSLHKWSVNNIEEFWQAFVEYSELIYHSNYNRIVDTYKMPGVQWFEGMKLNFAENIFEKDFSGPAVKYISENDSYGINENYISEYSYEELKSAVTRCANGLKKIGINKGDYVAGYVANIPEAIIACLACAAVGAVWSSASPDFGYEALYDRFSQVSPKLLFVSFEYNYGGKTFNNITVAEKLQQRIESIEQLICMPSPLNSLYPSGHVTWKGFLSSHDAGKINYEILPFDHPLYIMFSSGTTGVPKCMIHGAGGTLLQHRKEHLLHCDLKPGDKLMYFTTTGWMMWNWQLSALASGVTILLYDGNPAYPRLDMFWESAGKHEVTHLGTSGRYIESCMKSNYVTDNYWLGNLPALSTILYTGSPLSEAGFKWIYDFVKKDVHLAGISGGTDIISCFVLGNPVLPVFSGKIQSKGLAVDAAAFNEQGEEVLNEPGELVCRKPIPSMPVGFLNDKDGSKYRKAYFENYKDVWTHGDFIEFDNEGQCVIFGRSDATLNPGGVRIGCSEIYSALDSFNYINGSIAAGWNPQGISDEVIILLVVLNNNADLTNEQILEIKNSIKTKRSPRHVPKYVFQISELPVTRSGKPVELTVKAILNGKEIKNISALLNSHVLDEIVEIRQKINLE